jgi:hypothetical protein
MFATIENKHEYVVALDGMKAEKLAQMPLAPNAIDAVVNWNEWKDGALVGPVNRPIPLTSNVLLGVVVLIPTLPFERIVMRAFAIDAL